MPSEKKMLSPGTATKGTGGPRAACRKVICQVAPGALSPNIWPTQASSAAERSR